MISLRHIAAAASIGGACMAFASEPTDEPLTDVKANVDSGKAVLVDVREQVEWDRAHIEGAIFMPLGTIADGLSKEEAAKLPKDKIIYLHCGVGLRATAAGDHLEKLGYTVRPLEQGVRQLFAGGFPQAKE